MTVNRLCTRAVDFEPLSDEERASDGGGDGRTLEGYAAVFETPTEINSFEGHFTEKIARGAFKKTISERKPVLQFDHGHDARTGSVPIGKILDIREDKKGLFVSANLFDNPVVEPIRQAIDGGAISGMSFRFKVTRDEWRDNEGTRVKGDELGGLLWDPGKRGPLSRTIREVELFEAGPVVFPAYAATTVGVRSISEEDREALVEEYRRSAVVEEASGHCLGLHRVANCNCRICPSNDDGGHVHPELAACEACDDERAMTTGDAPTGQKVKKSGSGGSGDSKKPYGDVTYADPGYQADGKKRYPIDTAEHVKAAWSYINQQGNASKYSSSQLASIKSKIKAAAKKFGITISDDSGQKSQLPDQDAAFEGTSESENPRNDDAASEGTSSGIHPSARARQLALLALKRNEAA